MTSALAPDELLQRVERDVRRAVKRGRNGLRYAAGTRPPRVGRTPKDVIWKRDKAELWRYRSDTPVRWRPPVLVVHSLVSRSYVLDLQSGNSAVRFWLDRGIDVMLLDWGVADEVEAANGLETYCDDYVPDAIAAANAAAGCDDVTLLGYCFGGVLSLISLARHPDLPVRNLICMATPVDFAGMAAITAPVAAGRLDPEELHDETGNVPPEAVENAFRLLRPTGELTAYATLWQNLWNDDFMAGYQAMSQWTRDHVPFPGEAFRQTIDGLVRENGLMRGTLRLAGRDVDLAQITCPTLNVVAEHDHIVPIGAAESLPSLLEGARETDELRLEAGHVGLVASRTAAKVTLPRIAEWIEAHSDPVEA